jgi:hypothetical protein
VQECWSCWSVGVLEVSVTRSAMQSYVDSKGL